MFVPISEPFAKAHCSVEQRKLLDLCSRKHVTSQCDQNSSLKLVPKQLNAPFPRNYYVSYTWRVRTNTIDMQNDGTARFCMGAHDGEARALLCVCLVHISMAFANQYGLYAASMNVASIFYGKG